MPVRYLFKTLLLPPGILFLLLLLAWWLRRSRPRLALACFVSGLGGLWLMSLPIVVEQAARSVERVPPLPAAHWSTLAGQADVIVVLGNGRERHSPTWGTDMPTAIGLERLQLAARLAKVSGLPLLVTGGLHYYIAASKQVLIPDVEHPGLLIMVHELPAAKGTQITALNFSNQPITETLHLPADIIPGPVVDIINERVEGDLTEQGEFTINLEPYEGLALRVVSNLV